MDNLASVSFVKQMKFFKKPMTNSLASYHTKLRIMINQLLISRMVNKFIFISSSRLSRWKNKTVRGNIYAISVRNIETCVKVFALITDKFVIESSKCLSFFKKGRGRKFCDRTFNVCKT